jgi:SAM-dependent methyltransferase
MNRRHRKLCSSDEWAAVVSEQIVPATLEIDGLSLGDHVLELGPGYGATTAVLAERLPRLTVLELDQALVEHLRATVPPEVAVVEGDASAMPFPADRFSAVLAFTMLHHIAPAPRQDAVFGEALRVLNPGGVFAGSDIRRTLRLRLFHLRETFLPLDPSTLAARLEQSGFVDVAVRTDRWAVRFAARKSDEPPA